MPMYTTQWVRKMTIVEEDEIIAELNSKHRCIVKYITSPANFSTTFECFDISEEDYLILVIKHGEGLQNMLVELQDVTLVEHIHGVPEPWG